VRQNWSIKAMQRLIMTSSTYRQSSQLSAQSSERDLDNRLLSRSPLRRLDAEALRDALLFVSGKLDETPFGPAEKVERRDDGLVASIGRPEGWRRSIYVLQRRSQTSTILEDFDLPQMSPNCVERTFATVAPQALHLMNNGAIHGWALAMADRIARDCGPDRDAQIRRAYKLALGRPPDATELDVIVKSFEELREKWLGEIEKAESRTSSSNETVPRSDASRSPDDEAQLKALTNLCHALMNAAEFIYVD
jgi:hypothetical protein